MLIVLGGLPATGKSTLSALLAREMKAVRLRVDTIEQAMRNSGIAVSGPEGYLVACGLAEDNLRVGHTVIVDSVNPIEITRTYWRDIAERTGVEIVEIELICSDEAEHRHRVETRVADIPGHALPTWQQVMDRRYEPWDTAVAIDTAGHTVKESLSAMMSVLTSVCD